MFGNTRQRTKGRVHKLYCVSFRVGHDVCKRAGRWQHCGQTVELGFFWPCFDPQNYEKQWFGERSAIHVSLWALIWRLGLKGTCAAVWWFLLLATLDVGSIEAPLAANAHAPISSFSYWLWEMQIYPQIFSHAGKQKAGYYTLNRGGNSYSYTMVWSYIVYLKWY